MDIYKANLTGLLGLCGALYAAQYMHVGSSAEKDDASKKAQGDGSNTANGNGKDKTKETKAAKAATPASSANTSADFLVVYALVMAADWLQGPFLYSLYADEHKVPPHLVSVLFATGFVAGGLSASVVGAAADRYGRRRACLACCATYALSCLLTIASPRVPLLLAGRALGGISTSLLFSVFESWMVTDFWEGEKFEAGNAEVTEEASARLGQIFGQMGTLNSLAAIASGVFSEWAVAAAGTRKAPFAASVALLGLAAWRIAARWNENYGEAATKDKEDGGGRVWAVLRDPAVIVLGLASTLFEGSMYLFVFFWTPALQAVASSSSSSGSSSDAVPALPYGIIFASFMAAAMAATLAFNLVAAQHRLVRCATLLLGLLCAAEVVFYPLSSPKLSAALSEQAVFWLFCLFEACVGTYWPCMGYLKGQLVPDGARAQVYALLRVPLNVFVVAALLLTPSGDGVYASVFGVCSTLLVLAIAGVLSMLLNEPNLP